MFATILRRVLLLLLLSAATAATSRTLVIQSRIDQGPWRSVTAISPLRGQQVALRVAKIPGASIQWYQIRPYLNHMYKNANHPWEENPYQWVGLDRIEYERRVIPELQGQWEVRPFSTRTVRTPSPYYHADVGSFWFQVEVEQKGQLLRSPGLESTTRIGLSDRIFRVSIRDGDDYLGYISSYFNVPAIFGSVTDQSYDYLGVDCADVLIAAHRRWCGTRLRKNYNVSMLVRLFPRIAAARLQDGTPDPPISWHEGIRRGDLIAVRYPGAHQFQHIGALARDANDNGLLDGADLVLHAGPWPLQYSRLDAGGFDGDVVIIRPHKKL